MAFKEIEARYKTQESGLSGEAYPTINYKRFNEPMFTLEQIKEAHSRVKSGADFPAYIQDIKNLGVQAYTHYVADGHIVYNGANGYNISAPAKWDARPIAQPANTDGLKEALKIHQAGQTTYPQFCQQAAEAGVHNWVVDLQAMTCTYYDTEGGEMVVERIPG